MSESSDYERKIMRTNRVMVRDLSQKSGLETATVADLLSRGWRYVEKVGEISRWEHPMWKLDRRRDI